jgi:hypothetical protein
MATIKTQIVPVRLASKTGQTIRSVSYDYDLLDRLTTASYTTPGQRPANPPAGQSVSYTESLRSTDFGYDFVGNRTSSNLQDHTTTITLATDNNGLTTESRQTVAGPLQAVTAQFDDINRLISLTTANDPAGACDVSVRQEWQSHFDNPKLASPLRVMNTTAAISYAAP